MVVWARNFRLTSFRRMTIEVSFNDAIILLGEIFKDVVKLVKNNNDLLNLTQPQIVQEVHS